MRLERLKICSDCDNVWENEGGEGCPKCAGKSWQWVANWLPVIKDAEKPQSLDRGVS